ncbi:hypothetical protein NQZ68_042056 [Dissostichus eleginoides]|nr:hypothetical protein NQZ68_042056 [Dissostichus eleginoides]
MLDPRLKQSAASDSAVVTKPHDWACRGKEGSGCAWVTLAPNVAAASLAFLSPFTQAKPLHHYQHHPALSDVRSQGCWMLKESATAAGGRDKAPPPPQIKQQD